MDRILRSVPGQISLTVTDTSGNAADLDAAPAIAIADSAGVATGLAGASTRTGTGVYTFLASLAILDIYTATWTGTSGGQPAIFTTEFEVVGGFYFTIPDARAYMLNGAAGLASASAYPAATIVAERNRIEDRWESECGVAFVPRGHRATLNGLGTKFLTLPRHRVRRIVAITLDGTPFTAAQLANVSVESWGGVTYNTGTFTNTTPANVTVLYEHGYDQVPGDVQRAALRLLSRALLPSSLEDTVTAFTNELGTRSMATASGPLMRPFGIPEVDAIYWSRRERAWAR